MPKKVAMATVAVLIIWLGMDYLIYDVIFRCEYESMGNLLRPYDEMIIWPTYFANALIALTFCAIYGVLVQPKSLFSGLALGILLGVMEGAKILISWSMSPVSDSMALILTFSAFAEFIVAGFVVGVTIKR